MTTEKPPYETMVSIEQRVATALGRSVEQILEMDLRELAEAVYDAGLEMNVSVDDTDGPIHLRMQMVDGDPERKKATA